MESEVLNLVKSTPNILGQVYGDLAQPSVKAVGNALGTVFEFSTSFLLPVKLLNEKFKLNFTKRLNEYKEKLEQIPKEKRCEVHPQIGTPIIEKLSYTTNEEIADLFTTLLANASNMDMANTAHPSFISLIGMMTPDEAKLLKYLNGKEVIPYCNFIGKSKKGKGFQTILRHATLLEDYIDFIYPQNISIYLANFVSLGILRDNFGISLVDKTIISNIKEKYSFDQLEDKLVPHKYKSITVEDSFFDITDFGDLFIKACIK